MASLDAINQAILKQTKPSQSKSESINKVETFLGDMPRPDWEKMMSYENIHEATEAGEWALGGGPNIIKTGEKLTPIAKKGLEYISPHKEISKAMEKFGGGATTSEENIENLGRELSLGRIKAEEEALVPKREFLSETKGKTIFKQKPFIPELGKQEYNLPRYLENKNFTKNFSAALEESHNNFIQNPTPEKLDKYLSDMKKEMRNIPEKTEKLNLINKKNRLIKNISNLSKEMENFVKDLPKEEQGKYQKFVDKWREEAKIYGDEDIIRQLSHGNFEGISSTDINRIMANPSKETIKILGQIGDPLRGHVMYNLLQKIDPKNVKGFAKAILDAKKTKGYQQFVTKDMEDLAHQLLKRYAIRSGLTDLLIGGATALTPLGLAGGAAAVGAKHALPHISQYLGKLLRK
jgi:hypothetical protein